MTKYILILSKNSQKGQNCFEVEGAYWFGPVRPSVCLSVTHALGQDPLEIGSCNLVCGRSMKIKRTHFFLSGGLVVVEI